MSKEGEREGRSRSSFEVFGTVDLGDWDVERKDRRVGVVVRFVEEEREV